jgi:hypothetical protein
MRAARFYGQAGPALLSRLKRGSLEVHPARCCDSSGRCGWWLMDEEGPVVDAASRSGASCK